MRTKEKHDARSTTKNLQNIHDKTIQPSSRKQQWTKFCGLLRTSNEKDIATLFSPDTFLQKMGHLF